jgi:hypothetical protein
MHTYRDKRVVGDNIAFFVRRFNAFLYTMDFFGHKLCPNRCYLPFFHFPERSIALVKRLAGSPKRAEIDPNLPHATKCVLQGSTRILIYIDGLLSVIKLCPNRCYLPLPISRISLGSKTDWTGAEIDPNLPTC